MEVYIIMHGMYYEYENIFMVCSKYEKAKNELEKILKKSKVENEQEYIETKKDYWEWLDIKYFYIQEHTVY